LNKYDTFESERLLYKGISEQDTDFLVRWRSNPDFYQYFRSSTPITKENHLEWYKKTYLNDFSRFDFILIDKQSENKIGYVGVSKVNDEDNSFEISYLIGEIEFQRRGLACESIIKMIDIMLKEGYSTIYAEIHKENIASIKTIQKMGFKIFSNQDDFIKYVIKIDRVSYCKR